MPSMPVPRAAIRRHFSRRDAAKAFLARLFNLTPPPPRSVFGLPLAEAVAVAGAPTMLPVAPATPCVVPLPVALAAARVLEAGREVEGVLRVSAKPSRLQELAARLDDVCLSTTASRTALVTRETWHQGFTVHEVAGVLKRYLHELPEPVCTKALYDAFCSLPTQVQGKDAEAARVTVQRLVRLLPVAAQHTLLYMLGFIAKLAQAEPTTRMTLDNLCMVLQPSMLSHPRDATNPAAYQQAARALRIMVDHIAALHCEIWPAHTAALATAETVVGGGGDGGAATADPATRDPSKLERRATVLGTLSKRARADSTRADNTPSGASRPSTASTASSSAHPQAMASAAPPTRAVSLGQKAKTPPASARSAAPALFSTLARRQTLPARFSRTPRVKRTGSDHDRWHA